MDRYGPEKILQIYQPATGSLGILIVDNTAFGPGLGGIYLSENVTVETAFEKARTHTIMNALHDVPFGGACAYITKRGDTRLDLQEFAAGIIPYANKIFIAQPGEGLTEELMEVYAYSCGDVRGAVGKPSSLKGIPFQAGQVGLGIAHCTIQALNARKIEKPKVMLFGLGIDAGFAGRVLERNGVSIVGAVDSDGGTVNSDGLDFNSLSKMLRDGGRADAFNGGTPVSFEQALSEKFDVMIATEHLTKKLIGNVRPRIVIEGKMGAVYGIEQQLELDGVTVIPDILACGGMSISSHIEYIGGNLTDMTEVISHSMQRTAFDTIERSGTSVRTGATNIAMEKIEHKMRENSSDLTSWQKIIAAD